MSKELGQFFTINEGLQQYVFDRVEHRGALLLEPSFGSGHLLKKFLESNPDYPIECYEIDSSIEPCIKFNDKQSIIYSDFMSHEFDKKFKTIIGNPPYVKKSKGNLYIQFIEKCYHLLHDDGELIFIVPSDFIKLTSASKIILEMIREGSFTHFHFPHDEKLFNSASIDVVVFRYKKGVYQNIVNVDDDIKYCNVIDGILTLNDEPQCGNIVSNIFSTYVGLVSGRDDVYKVPFGMTDVLVDENNIEKFIFPTKFPTENEKINEHLTKHKDKLLSRKIKKFNEDNWFEWGAPRNIKTMEDNMGRPCIYVKNLTRNRNIAFKGTVTYFGGKLLCLIPHTEIELDAIVKYLNSDMFKRNYMYAGRFKIGQRQLANAVLSDIKKREI